MRLPSEALTYRRQHSMLSEGHLRAINITAWLYRDADGFTKVQVNPNTPIQELIERFGRAETPDAEVGFHSEAVAAEWFRTHPGLQVLQIFTERYPCPKMCAPLIRRYYPGVPWFYYYDRWSFTEGRRVVRTAAEVLRTAYGL
jgi:hypothetical protein